MLMAGVGVCAAAGAFLIETASEFIARRRGQLRPPFVRTEEGMRGRQSAERDDRVAALQPPERIAADEQAGRHIAGGEPALAPRNRQVPAQLAQAMNCWQRDGTAR